MDTAVEQAEFSVRPLRLAAELRAARDALGNTRPQAARHLDALSALADFAGLIAGSPLRVAVSMAAAFVCIRIAQLTYLGLYSIVPGPWWNWDYLLSFDARAFVAGACAVALCAIASVVLCRRLARRVLQSVRTGAVAPQPIWRYSTHVIVVALALGCAALAFSAAQSSSSVERCKSDWQASALGPGWWLLVCPVSSDGCMATHNGESLLILAGHSLIIAAANLQSLEYTNQGCVQNPSVLSNESRPVERRVIAQPLAFDANQFALLDQTLQRIADKSMKVSLDLGAGVPKLDGLVRSIDGLVRELTAHRKDSPGNSCTQTCSPTGPGDGHDESLVHVLEKFNGQLTDFLAQWEKSNKNAEQTMRILAGCQMRPGADDLRKRAGYFLHGYDPCRHLLDSMPPQSPTEPPRPSPPVQPQQPVKPDTKGGQ